MTKRYLLFIPMGGFVDCISVINSMIQTCRNNGLIMLLYMKNSEYNINLSVCFDIKGTACQIIFDNNEIEHILSNITGNIHPPILTDKIQELTEQKLQFRCHRDWYSFQNIKLNIPNNQEIYSLIVACKCRNIPPNFNLFFNNMIPNDNIKKYCFENKRKIGNNYLFIHVRHTDHKSDYSTLYEKNKNKINSYDKVYLATDNKSVLEFFQDKCQNIYNFTVFPTPEQMTKNLHSSNMDSILKMKCLMSDIYLANNCNEFISNSRGGFTNLLNGLSKGNKLKHF